MAQGRFIRDFEKAASSLLNQTGLGRLRAGLGAQEMPPGQNWGTWAEGGLMGSTFQAMLWAPLDINRGLCDVGGNHLIPPPFFTKKDLSLF